MVYTMGSLPIDLDAELDNVRKLLSHAGERGITDFGRLLAIYHRSTGLGEKQEHARGYMRLRMSGLSMGTGGQRTLLAAVWATDVI